MKTEVETALKEMLKKSTRYTAIEAMQYTQAALNLAHVLATLDHLKA